MSVTIKDVARAAEVSVATVSRVLNNSPSVSDRTAERIHKVIEQMGYNPNSLGRNLRKRETNNILVILPSTQQTFYSEIIRGIQDAAASDYDILLCTSYSYINTEMRLLNMLHNHTVDAAILMGTQLDAKALNSLSADHNIALCCESVEGAEVLTVTIDNEKAAFDAVCHLIESGRKRIGFVTTSGVSAAMSSVDRERGYLRALNKYGIEKNDDYIYRCTYDYQNGFDALDYFMSLKTPPDAVFCISDLLAVGVIKHAYKKGIEIGKELAVCGFDNINLCEMYIPEITTVEQPGYEMGRTVIRKLINNMQNDYRDNSTVLLEHKLIIRDSAK